MEFLDEKKYVDQAEKVLDNLVEKKNNKGYPVGLLSTTKIRGLLSIAADIYDKVMQNADAELSSDLVSRIDYLRVRMIYEYGRDRDFKVQSFFNESQLIEYVKMIGNDKKKYILFYRYMEALVAFHRYRGGKEN